MFPHCCTQAGCWAHKDACRCDCCCAWCRVARLCRRSILRRDRDWDWDRAELHQGIHPGLVISVRFTPEEADIVLAEAKAQEISTVEYVRRQALAHESGVQGRK